MRISIFGAVQVVLTTGKGSMVSEIRWGGRYVTENYVHGASSVGSNMGSQEKCLFFLFFAIFYILLKINRIIHPYKEICRKQCSLFSSRGIVGL